jgi:hypothetical protein
MLMNCCNAVTEATVVTSSTQTKVPPVVPAPVPATQGVGSAAISAAYELFPVPESPPSVVMYRYVPGVQGDAPPVLKLKFPLESVVVVLTEVAAEP